MHTQHHLDGDWSEAAEYALEEGISRLQRRINRFGLTDDIELETWVETEDGGTRVRFELRAPGDVQTAAVTHPEPPRAVRSAMELLLQRFDNYNFELDPARWRPGAHARAEEAGVEAFRDRLLRHALPALHRVARHDIELATAEGAELPPAYLDPADIVDAAVAAVLDELRPEDGVVAATERLVEALREELAIEVRRAGHALDENIHLDAPGQALGAAPPIEPVPDENVDPHRTRDLPDLDELIAESEALDPEALVGERRSREVLVRALFDVPEPLRQLFAQVVLDEWSEKTVAAAWRREQVEVAALVHAATVRLAERLELDHDQVLDTYQALGRRLREERKAHERELAIP